MTFEEKSKLLADLKDIMDRVEKIETKDQEKHPENETQWADRYYDHLKAKYAASK